MTLDGAGPPGRRNGHLTLLAETQRGYANLCRLISAGQLAGQKGQPRLTLETLAEHAEGLICLSGCRQGAVPAALLAKTRTQRAPGRQADCATSLAPTASGSSCSATACRPTPG